MVRTQQFKNYVGDGVRTYSSIKIFFALKRRHFFLVVDASSILRFHGDRTAPGAAAGAGVAGWLLVILSVTDTFCTVPRSLEGEEETVG